MIDLTILGADNNDAIDQRSEIREKVEFPDIPIVKNEERPFAWVNSRFS